MYYPRKALIERIENKFNHSSNYYFANDVEIILRDANRLVLPKEQIEKLNQIKANFNYNCKESVLQTLKEVYWLLQEE